MLGSKLIRIINDPHLSFHFPDRTKMHKADITVGNTVVVQINQIFNVLPLS